MLRERMHFPIEVGKREVRCLEGGQRALAILRCFAEAPHLVSIVDDDRLPDEVGQRGEVVAAAILEVSLARGRNRIAVIAFAEAFGLALETSDSLEVPGAQPQAIFRVRVDALEDVLTVNDIDRHVAAPARRGTCARAMLFACRAAEKRMSRR